MNISATRQQRRALQTENRARPEHLEQIPRSQWPSAGPSNVIEVWRSRGFLVQVYAEDNAVERLSVCRTALAGGNWQQNVTWDELQRLKRECGRGDRQAVEIYPADHDVVNVANMRHLWLLPAPVPVGWRS